uniref:Phosphatase and actin regulator n=1 Tax=Haemonchus contortus TaxID=6289 RepID=A0A7I4YN15_HAECO
MADSKAPLTAAERRERRLNRILGDGENRIKKILSGPDGGEQRLPPMLEGGEYKFPLLSNGEEKQEEEETESTPSIPTLSSNRPSPTNQLLSKIRQMDIPLSLLYGLFIRLVMVRWSAFNVFLPWFLLFFGSRFLSFVQDGFLFFE